MTAKPTEKLLLRELYDSQKRVEEKQTRIEMALFGDQDAGIAGVIGTIKKHDKKISLHEKILWIGTGVLLAIKAIKEYF